MLVAEELLSEFAKSIELTGTKVLEGFHMSVRGGSGVEFHELKPYSEGEDSRFIDWKRFASSDRYLTRKFERQERTSWKVWVDSSESMSYGDKQSWARSFAASLLYLSQSLGDSWQLIGYEGIKLAEAYQALLKNETPSRWEDLLDLDLKRGDRLILISDFFFDLEKFLKKIEYEQGHAHQVIFLQTLEAKEASFSFEGVVEFEDRESPSKLILDARSVKAAFLSALKQHQQTIKDSLQMNDQFLAYETNLERLPQQIAEFFEVA